MAIRTVGFWIFHTMPPSGCQYANSAINARLESNTYVLRSAGSATMRVHARLNHGRAITLCCTAKIPSNSTSIPSADRNGIRPGESIVLGTTRFPIKPTE
jgi:hypothetical protein